MASFVTFATAIYSVSTVDNATVDCFFADQKMELLVISKKNPPWIGGNQGPAPIRVSSSDKINGFTFTGSKG